VVKRGEGIVYIVHIIFSSEVRLKDKRRLKGKKKIKSKKNKRLFFPSNFNNVQMEISDLK